MLHEPRRETRKAVELGVRIKVFRLHGAALDVTKLAHPMSIFFQ
jgi:hypothetical protein